MAKLSFKEFFIETKHEKKGKIKNIIDGQGLVMFFKKNGKLFGAPEESRIVFAKLKNPDDEDISGCDDANFAAYDLMQALSGNSTENLFSLKDMPEINMVDREKMEKELMGCPDISSEIPNLKNIKPDIGLIKLRDEE